MKDNRLRQKRVVYYKEDLDQIDKLLEEFLKLSSAKSIFLVDTEGHLITQKGPAQTLNPETLSALVAGSFAATKELARILGETEFAVMFHQGKKDHIHISLVASRAITATVFNEKTTVGMVNLYSKELCSKLEKIFEIASKRVVHDDPLDDDFNDSVQDALKDMFGE